MEDEDGAMSPRKKYKEDEDEEEENGGNKQNGEVKINGISKNYNEDDNNGNEKLNTVEDAITANE